jgi:DNA-binding CsgD family transcriptional regulator
MLIGRDQELAEIEAAVRSAAEGRTSSLVIEGEPGIGKSALLAEAVALAEDLGLTTLRAHGVESEHDLAFAGIVELAGPLAEARKRLPPTQRQALATALAEEEGPPPDPFAVAAALLGTISLVADEGGALVAVDDAQWLDAQSLAAVLFAARRLSHQGVAFLLATRPAPELDFQGERLRRLELSALEEGAAGELLESAAAKPIGPEARSRLLEVAAGNPLALIETPRMLNAKQLAGEEPLPDAIEPGAAIERSLGSRIEALDEPARAALLVAAAAEEIDLATCAAALAALGLDPEDLLRAERAGIVTTDGARVRFTHPLLRSVAYLRADPSERRAAHEAIAAAVSDRDLALRGWHLAKAAEGPDEDVAAILTAAAADSRGRGAVTSAAELDSLAASLSPAPADRVARTLAAADDLARIGALPRAAALLDDVATISGDDVLGLRVRHDRAILSMRLGDLTAGHRLLHEAAALMERLDPAAAATILLEANFRDWMAGDYEALRRTALRAGELAKAGGSDGLLALVDTQLAIVAVLTGEPVEADAISRHERVLVEGVPGVETEAFTAAIHAAIWVEQFDWAERVLAPIVAGARARSALIELIYPLTVLGDLERRRGNLDVARAHGDEAVALAYETSQPQMLALAAGPLALTEAALGMPGSCREHAMTSIALCDEAGALAMSLWGRAALGRSAALAGEWDRALAPLEECEDIAARIGLREPRFGAWAADLIEARIRNDDEAGALRTIEELEVVAEATGGHWPAGAAARGRGLLGPDEELDEHMPAAADAFHRGGAALEEGRTLLLWGERLRRARRRSDSREPLRRAQLLFERCGQRALAERAGRELEASGATVAGRSPEMRDRLTPHELRIAMRVAEGRTNPEVAAELFVSRKTVEHHLSQVYRKLGVRSRTELARVLAPGLPEHPESANVLGDPV